MRLNKTTRHYTIMGDEFIAALGMTGTTIKSFHMETKCHKGEYYQIVYIEVQDDE